MGCSNEKPTAQGTLLEQYHAANLPQPWATDYENNFEKEIYMAVNLCRHDPKRFVPHVRKVYKEHVLLRAGAGKKMEDLIAKLKVTETMGPIRLDQQANEACRQVNADIIAKDEAAPALGGNIAKYSELSGGDKADTSHEFTMVKFEGTTGEEFIALQMALDFEDFEGAKKAKAPEAAQPAEAVAEAEAEVAGDKSSGEEAKKVEKKEIPTGYTPVLDQLIEQMGVSNKAHKKTINVIQILYCQAATTALI
jgi:hypothetical protein